VESGQRNNSSAASKNDENQEFSGQNELCDFDEKEEE
jgi:hypothetical protein